MARQNIGGTMDDGNLNKVNYNFIELYQMHQRMTATLNDLILESGGDSNLEVVQARGGKPVLNDRLNIIDSQLAEKANEKDVDDRLNDISVSQINKNKGLIDESYLSDELKQQMAGNTPIHSTPAYKSVTLDKLAILKESTNLFDVNSKEVGKYVSPISGVVIEDSNFQLSGKIRAKPNQNYYVARTRHVAFFDNNNNFISGISGGGNNHVFTTPENTSYFLFSWESNLFNNNQQVNEGSEKLPYEHFYKYIDGRYVERQTIEEKDIPKKAISYDKTDFVVLGKNLFNKNEVTIGRYVNDTNGNLATNESYAATEFIEIEEETEYSMNYHYRTAFYDENKIFISGINDFNQSGRTVLTPEKAKFVRTTIGINLIDDFQLEKGTESTAYEPYGYKIPNLIKDTQNIVTDDVLVFLPSEICVAVGRTIELYNEQVIWTGNMNNVHVQWKSSIGKSFARKWSFEGTESTIGEHSLVINVYDNNMNILESKSTTVKVVDDSIESINLLTIGDSLTNSKPWLGEIKSLSGEKINNIGTRGLGTNKHEGRSGVRASWYLNDSEYTFDSNYDGSNPNTDGSENPFWNPTTEKFDFDYYKSTYNKNPDAVQIFLGTNGIKLVPTDNVDDIKAIVDGIRQSDSNIPIFVVFTLYRGNQDGIANQASNDGYSAFRSEWKLEEDRKVFNQMVALNDTLKTYSNLYFVPISLTHDSKYNFGWSEINVNPRSEVKEFHPIESVHPQNAGYMQFADIMFSTIVANV